MTIAELIEFLKDQPQDLLVGYAKYSEYKVLELDEIQQLSLCEPREDGWLQLQRSDKPFQQYLIFPGN